MVTESVVQSVVVKIDIKMEYGPVQSDLNNVGYVETVVTTGLIPGCNLLLTNLDKGLVIMTDEKKALLLEGLTLLYFCQSRVWHLMDATKLKQIRDLIEELRNNED